MNKINIEQPNGLIFELDKDTETATIVYSPNAIGKLHIPKYIQYESKEFIITAIKEFSFHRNQNIESLSFSEDSSLKQIFSNAFVDSSITSLSIPASLEYLNLRWSFGALSLCQIQVDPRNKRYVYIDDTFLIEKDEKGSHKSLIYVRRNVKGEIIIPSTVKCIDELAFFRCHQLKSVRFGENSSLQKINDCVFDCCENIRFIAPIPRSVRIIGSMSFEYLKKVGSIEFLSDEIIFGHICFWGCSSLVCISLPNAQKVGISKASLNGLGDEFSMFCKCYAEIYDN